MQPPPKLRKGKRKLEQQVNLFFAHIFSQIFTTAHKEEQPWTHTVTVMPTTRITRLP